MPSSQGFPKLSTAAVILALVVAAVLAPHGVEARLFAQQASGATQEGVLKSKLVVSDSSVEPQRATRRLQGAAPLALSLTCILGPAASLTWTFRNDRNPHPVPMRQSIYGS